MPAGDVPLADLAFTIANVATCGYIEGMKAIGIRALRNALSAWVRRVERGERVAVTDRGRVVALLMPAPRSDDPEARIRQLVSEGVLRPATESGPLFGGVKTFRLPKGTASALINEDRGER